MSQDLPSLNALRAFDAVARLGSLSQAAEELHVTHGAVSRQLRHLEEQLGLSLLRKDGRGVKLTLAGHRLSEATRSSFAQLRQACAELRQSSRDAPFVLSCPGSLLARWFIPRLDRLNRDLPELRLQLSASEGGLDSRHSNLDACLLFAEPPWPADRQVFDLAAERIGPVLSPSHPRAAQLCQAPATALLEEALLHTSSRPQAWPEWARAQQLAVDCLQFGQGFEHLYYLLEAAVAGLGVAIAPQTLVADDLQAGRLLAPWGFVETHARLVLWSSAHPENPRTALLAEWLQQQLASSASLEHA